VELNGLKYTVCPLYRLNSLGFIVSKKESTSSPNIRLLLGHFKNQVCLFGKSIRNILCGE